MGRPSSRFAGMVGMVAFGMLAAVAPLSAAGIPGAVRSVASPVTTPTVPIPAAAPTVPATTATTARASASSASGRTTATKAPTRTGSHRVAATGGKGVAVRSRPDPAATLLGRKAEGAVLTITCQVKGTLVRDATQNRSSTLWDKLSTGGYVANIYTTAYEPTKAGISTGLKACPASANVPKPTTTTARANAAASEGSTDTAPDAVVTTGGGSAATTQPGAVTVKTTVTNAN